MARWKNIETELNVLIAQITGFNEKEENFQLCSHFALSNIKYHRYLDVDSHKVTKSLLGVIDKFVIHSQQEKSEAFTRLLDEFLNSPAFENKDCGKTDTHYGLLNLLLCLADSPTHSDYVEKPPEVVEEVKDTFDWAGYLLEGENKLTFQDLDSEDDEEDIWSDENEREEEKTEEVTPTPGPQEEITLSTIPPDSSTLIEVEDVTVTETGFDWLMKNVVPQYWCGQTQDSHTCSSNLNVDWECYKRSTEPLHTTQSKTVITEVQLIREILWMLSGVSDLFVFIYNGRRFIIRENVIVPHLTDEALNDYLLNFTKYGAYVITLQKFIQNVSSCFFEKSQGYGVSQTYEAFSRTISTFLGNFRKELTDLEKIIIRQEETVTLMSTHSSLQDWLKKIEVVYSLYNKGIIEAEVLQTNCQKASHLLNVLYNTVIEYDDSGQSGIQIVELLFPMWIETIKPYIDIIDEWITNGTLVDPKSEFILKRDENVTSLHQTFWEKTFTTHIPTESESENETSSAAGDTTTNNSNKLLAGQYQSWAPGFLQTVLLEIVLAGKSMEMLKDSGRLKEVVGGHDDIYFRCTPLFQEFLKSMETFLDFSTPENETTEKIKEVPTTTFTTQIEQQMKLKGIYDPLLKINVDTLFTKCVTNLEKPSKEDINERLVRTLKTERLKPIPELHFFLMEAGDTMFCFYTEIFDKNATIHQYRALSVHDLSDCVNNGEILTVDVDYTNTNKDGSLINVTDCLKLQYKVEWPIDIVITSECQDIYNQIFCFLLQIKRAKYSLDELRFFDLEKENILHSFSGGEESLISRLDDDMPRSGRVHRMHILKMRLTFFVNSLHNYIMTRILHSTGLEFKQEMDKATDLDQIIDIHGKYVSKIHERCLLHKKVKFLKEAVMKVLNLILIFQKRWDQGIDEISLKIIEDMETEFSRCIQFLASFLNNWSP
ncbi:hypothetical protein KUTeg_023121 [Tegillarca granosa]|uniref:Gamma-tubulin complex component n=1 Tax=Tegillarca granosa TaxID=220873 RepID=A0ABQ9E0Q7_TEGGR|nr:hypothetical protein KUTeg_023121 [Tegillarca granosa]